MLQQHVKSLLSHVVYVYEYTYVRLPNSYTRVGCDTWSIFKRSFTGLNAEFSFSETGWHTKSKLPSQLNYLIIASGKIVVFKYFPNVLELSETKTVSTSIWSRVTMPISNINNH